MYLDNNVHIPPKRYLSKKQKEKEMPQNKATVRYIACLER